MDDDADADDDNEVNMPPGKASVGLIKGSKKKLLSLDKHDVRMHDTGHYFVDGRVGQCGSRGMESARSLHGSGE